MDSGHPDVDDPFQTAPLAPALAPCKNTRARPPDTGLQGTNATSARWAAGMPVPPPAHTTEE